MSWLNCGTFILNATVLIKCIAIKNKADYPDIER